MNEDLAHLQEEPSGRPWFNDNVRTWEPAPFDPERYERFAARQARRPVVTFTAEVSHDLWKVLIGEPLL